MRAPNFSVVLSPSQMLREGPESASSVCTKSIELYSFKAIWANGQFIFSALGFGRIRSGRQEVMEVRRVEH